VPALIHIRYTKYDGSLHWHYDAVDLGDDDLGRWFALMPGDPYRRGHEPVRHATHGFVGFVPYEGAWSAEFNPTPLGGSLIYVNVNTPAVFTDGAIEMADLDLDVVLRPDGSIALLDEDELEEHAVAMSYPERIVDLARATAASVWIALEQCTEPYRTRGPAKMAEALGWAHGVVVAGHGAASGRDPRYPEGTLALQEPHFAAAGVDVSPYRAATINLDVSPLRLIPSAPRATVRDVRWHPDVAAEDFSFLDARISAGGETHDALVYRPHPETKPDHPQPPTVVEVLAPPIPDLALGQIASVWVDPTQGSLLPAK
jgi:hypothetical protein